MSAYKYSIGKYTYQYAKTDAEEATGPVRPYAPEENANGETTGVAGHGLSGYRRRRCRCAVCRAAKARSAAVYHHRRKAEGRRVQASVTELGVEAEQRTQLQADHRRLTLTNRSVRPD